jgi:CDP-diacylglycerol---glycerol-3-phosphate 3-phosphatidyltransferase
MILVKSHTRRMKRADTITASRIVLTPLALFFLFVPELFGVGSVWAMIIVWVIGVYSEISDYLDGKTARKYSEVSDFGKVFDPFADVLMHLSYFIAFAVLDIIPLAFVIVVLFREYAVMLIRLLCAKDGVIMGARRGGKIKTVSYVVTAAAALLRLSLNRWNAPAGTDMIFSILVTCFCVVSGALAILSLWDYYREYRKLEANLKSKR